MPAKPAPIKKAAKKELPEKKVEKAPEPAPEPEPAPVPVEPEAAPAAVEEAPPAVEEAPPAEEAPAETPAEGAAEPPAEAPAEVVVEAPPPPPPEPTSAPLDLFIEDKNDTSVSIIWSQPETVGDSGLDGYLIEVCKDGTEDWKAVNEELHKSTRYAIKNQTTGDKLKIRVVAVNAGGRSAPGALPEAVLVKEVADRPKVRMPRFLRQRYVANVGEKINLTIPFTWTFVDKYIQSSQQYWFGPKDKPKPVVTWTKDGQPLDTKRVQVRSTERDSILFVRVSVREDSGVYEMCVKVDDFEDKASLILQISCPGPPATAKIVDTWGFNVALEWTPPVDSGQHGPSLDLHHPEGRQEDRRPRESARGSAGEAPREARQPSTILPPPKKPHPHHPTPPQPPPRNRTTTCHHRPTLQTAQQPPTHLNQHRTDPTAPTTRDDSHSTHHQPPRNRHPTNRQGPHSHLPDTDRPPPHRHDPTPPSARPPPPTTDTTGHPHQPPRPGPPHDLHDRHPHNLHAPTTPPRHPHRQTSTRDASPTTPASLHFRPSSLPSHLHHLQHISYPPNLHYPNLHPTYTTPITSIPSMNLHSLKY
ncbi:unnamed protein product [Arctogadus glacialis]